MQEKREHRVNIIFVGEKREPTLLEIQKENEATELIRLLKDQTQSQAVFDRCRKFLGE